MTRRRAPPLDRRGDSQWDPQAVEAPAIGGDVGGHQIAYAFNAASEFVALSMAPGRVHPPLRFAGRIHAHA